MMTDRADLRMVYSGVERYACQVDGTYVHGRISLFLFLSQPRSRGLLGFLATSAATYTAQSAYFSMSMK